MRQVRRALVAPAGALVSMGALLVALGSTSGCYLAHEREPRADGGARDAGPRDAASPDAFTIDAGPRGCRSVVVAHTVLLDEGVTPRIAALPGGDVGVVYVRSDAGPVRVVYERLDRTLARITGPVTVATDSFTWAELAIVGGESWIAYGGTGDAESKLVRASFDGTPIAPPWGVPMLHPSLLQPTGEGVLWIAFRMSGENSLELAHLDAAGELTHPPSMIALGRYGSGHGAIARDDGRGGHVLTYPREGPPGMRHGHVSAISAAGELGPERQLDALESDDVVLPVRHEGSLVLVRRIDDALVLERADFATLETSERFRFPRIGRPMPGVIADRLVVAHATGATLSIDDFGPDLDTFERQDVALPSPSTGSGTSVAELPGALVLALAVAEGPTSRPWLVRLECAAE